jgi:hypothetical protein
MRVRQGLGEDPFSGAVYGFRGRRAGLTKLHWHAGIGLCLAIHFNHRPDRSDAATASSAAGRLRMAGTTAAEATAVNGLITQESLTATGSGKS